MAKTVVFRELLKTPTHYVLRHSEGEEIVQCTSDDEFGKWAQGRVSETAQTVLATFVASVLKKSNGNCAALDQHKGKSVTLDLLGDFTSAKSQLRVH